MKHHDMPGCVRQGLCHSQGFMCCVLCCVQVVEEVFDPQAAEVMGIGQKGTVCIMIHSGSRGLGHQVTLQGLGWHLQY